MIAGRPHRVAIADDQGAVRMLLRLTLEMQGDGAFEVVAEAKDGETLLEKIATDPPEAVLLDLTMPGMGGIRAIPLIRQTAPATKIIILSAFEPGPESEAALAAGANAFLPKSLDPDETVRRLLRLLEPELA